MAPVPNQQSTLKMLSGSLNIYRRNFSILFLIFLVSLALLSIPLFFSLKGFIDELNQILKGVDDALAFYMLAYIVRPMIYPIGLMIAFICGIGIFTTPLFLGIAGKIISENIKGRTYGLREAFAWTRSNYKKLVTAFALYYGLLIAYGIISSAVLLWISYYSSHLVSDVWLNPSMALFAGGAVFILLGTIFIPFGIIEEGRGGFGAIGYSFKMMYSKRFLMNFTNLLLAGAIALVFLYAVQLPVSHQYVFAGLAGSSWFEAFIKFALNIQNDIITIIIAIVASSLAGVFLYIFAYNTYHQAGHKTYPGTNNKTRYNNSNNNPYRRKINEQLDVQNNVQKQSAYRRRIG